MHPLIKSIRNVSKEVSINYFRISNLELQQIVIASNHVERLVFHDCDINISEPLNFGKHSKSNIKFLSFSNCGRGARQPSETFNPSCFKNIIEAIANSGLRISLKKFDIFHCGIGKAIVTKMFSKLGMDDIHVDYFAYFPQAH